MEVKVGELNTKYFQTIVNARARMNSVSKLMIEGELVEDRKKIEKHVAGFFKNLYKEPKSWRPRLEGLEFKKIAEEEKDRLEEVILEKEVKEAIDGLGGEKAPGPDGFPIIFFKKCWDFMKEDIMKVVDEFQFEGFLDWRLNHMFIRLIPKVECVENVGDFRPISLLSSVYKIISKVLPSRLKGVIGGVISQNQSAFVKGRQITDCCLVANGLIDSRRKQGGGGL
ncbi:amidase [Ranunculus cassubicifolius]